MAQIIELNIAIESAITKTLEVLRIGDANAEPRRVGVVNGSGKWNEMVHRNFVRAQVQHERNGFVLFFQRPGQTVNPARLNAQSRVRRRADALAYLRRGHS